VNYERVELSRSDWIDHNIVGLYALLPTVFVLAELVFDPSARIPTSLVLVSAPIAGLLFWSQRRALRYRVLHTSGNEEANYAAVLVLASREKWQVTHHQLGSYFEALVAPELWGRSYKRRVSIRFRGDELYMNVIANPGRFHHPGLLPISDREQDLHAVAEAVGGSFTEAGPRGTRRPLSR
jgi:hypothetical protein